MLFRKLFARKKLRPAVAPNRDRSSKMAKPGNMEVALNPIALLVKGATQY